MKSYPHEMSGGQRQRVMIAMALANDPDILIADEPTTALDVTIQAQILMLLAELQRKLGMAIVFITHDLGIVRRFADRVYVMRRARWSRKGETEAIFVNPQHAYTKMLLAAEPTGTQGAAAGERAGPARRPECRSRFRIGGGFLAGEPLMLRAVDRISIGLRTGPDHRHRRRIRLRQIDARPRLAAAAAERRRHPFRRMRHFQGRPPGDAAAAARTAAGLPGSVRLAVAAHDCRPDHHRRAAGARAGLSGKQRDQRAVEALQEVGLDPNARNRYPHEFSGGQRQRIAIARAMILKPKVVVLDEPTSALDRSVQKQIVELLRKLQADHELSYLFISHDLAVVRAMADYIIVMKQGKIVEEGPTEAIFDNPRDDYTQTLMAAAIDSTRFRQVAKLAG